MPVNRDAIGARGEAIVMVELTRRHGRDEPFFRPHFMGEKYPAIDFFVELVGGVENQTPFFLAQVKTTSTGYTPGGRLNARATPSEMAKLMRYPVPLSHRRRRRSGRRFPRRGDHWRQSPVPELADSPPARRPRHAANLVR